MVTKEILVQMDAGEIAVAVLENGRLVEIYLERSDSQRLVGNIYKGKVINVLPGMQAAFVDIGLEKNAFLYVGDVVAFEGEGEKPPRNYLQINDILKEGQEILVQVAKEPLGSKGARVTTHISLPGHYVVLMPTVNYIGISRRITDEAERDRLRALAQRVKPRGMGLIIRTAAEHVTLGELRADVESLNQTWKKVRQAARRGKVPRLVYQDLGLLERVFRDLCSEDVERLLTNDRTIYGQISQLLRTSHPGLKNRLYLREGADLFGLYGIYSEIDQALKRKVWLKCGGYLIIDQMEALTAIDVNTGKYVGRHNLEETILRTNMEAAVEVARQLRLRNIGGIIIVDFIDMEQPAHRERVLSLLEEELKKDKTRSQVLGLTRLGLVEITRKKARPALGNFLQRDCPYCHGTGKVLSEETIAHQAKREIFSLASKTKAPAILIEANIAVAQLLENDFARLEERCGKKLVIRASSELPLQNVRLKELHDWEPARAGKK
ncbi:MAG: ribonuclease [Clostridia bacterium]|nr:ribonuclease [Clostridia bacterium]